MNPDACPPASPKPSSCCHLPFGGVNDIFVVTTWPLREKLNEILVNLTGQDYDRIQTDTDRDYFMGAFEAKEYGIIDEVITKRELP